LRLRLRGFLQQTFHKHELHLIPLEKRVLPVKAALQRN